MMMYDTRSGDAVSATGRALALELNALLHAGPATFDDVVASGRSTVPMTSREASPTR
jgi:hypothetical protein